LKSLGKLREVNGNMWSEFAIGQSDAVTNWDKTNGTRQGGEGSNKMGDKENDLLGKRASSNEDYAENFEPDAEKKRKQ